MSQIIARLNAYAEQIANKSDLCEIKRKSYLSERFSLALRTFMCYHTDIMGEVCPPPETEIKPTRKPRLNRHENRRENQG